MTAFGDAMKSRKPSNQVTLELIEGVLSGIRAWGGTENAALAEKMIADISIAKTEAKRKPETAARVVRITAIQLSTRRRAVDKRDRTYFESWNCAESRALSEGRCSGPTRDETVVQR
jgi:hypothetical protein